MLYSYILRPLFFLLPAETAHHVTFKLIHWLFPIPFIRKLVLGSVKSSVNESVNLWGLHFTNRVGLAAGFDKNALLLSQWATMGFGFIEIGTVTPRPQAGNPKPRLFRLPKDQALINRMGFNNDGVDQISFRLKSRPSSLIVGGNIGKNKDTPNEQAAEDYCTCLRVLAPFVDFFTVNISSPNTPGLRALQDKEPLLQLLLKIREENALLNKPKPLLLKIAPDLNELQIDDVLEVVDQVGLDGLIISNTTIDRSGLQSSKERLDKIGAGGLSGKPLRDKSDQLLKYVVDRTKGKLPIIAVGGIFSAEDAKHKIQLGASLVQIYTGMVYTGPKLVVDIRRALSQK